MSNEFIYALMTLDVDILLSQLTLTYSRHNFFKPVTCTSDHFIFVVVSHGSC